MYHLHHHVHFRYLRILKNELYELYIAHTLRWFAISLINIFIPIYLLGLGYALNEVLMFYIVEFAVVLPMAFISVLISTRVGLKHTMLFHLPILLSFFIGLYFLQTIKIPLPLLAFLLGTEAAMYWMPLHSLFAKNSHKIHRGEEVARISILPKLAAIFAPLIGGLIAVTLGFGILLILVMLILFLSIIPIFFTKEVKPHVNFSLRKFRLFFREDPKFFFATMFQYAEGIIEIVIWPIFVFLTLKSIVSVGIVGTLISVGSIVFMFSIGKLTDKLDRKFLIRVGGITLAAAWFARIFFTEPILIYLITFLGGFFAILIDIPFTAIAYDKASRRSRDEFIVYREIAVTTGRLLVLILALFVLEKFIVSFSLAGLASLFFLFF